MEEIKSLFDVIYLSDRELGIDSDHEDDRPCLIVGIDNLTGEGYVVPLTSKNNQRDSNGMKYKLAFGSFIDLSHTPIMITENQLRWSNKSDYWVDGEDVEVLEERYWKWINMGEEEEF